ncbi:hypothetical protein [Halomonas sp. KX33721]|jgi:hypothetical protein|uniref:hypothetical protein n=1 Tax=Halomonas sp. KX33721 TaxID=1819251 RepID=UPI0007829110|nr:hypothetical protein [Halomonas sp. KX33721]|tara:strand:+ start:69 stop:608 length:540 start_codon:yes stop_codon:yes gene_type:complete
MFNPIERGRQLREQRQLAKGCGFCGIADNTPETALYQSMGASAPTADSLRIHADKPHTGETRKFSANYPQVTTPAARHFSANPQNPQRVTADDVETILSSLKVVGRELREIEPLARAVMLSMSRQAAAELAVTLDDAFTVASSHSEARAQCRRLLNDPSALADAKAAWPDFPPAPAIST